MKSVKSILSAILTIALALVLVGTGTYAYLTDTETSSDNTLTAGTFDLLLTDGNPSPNAQWTISQGAPGADPLGAEGDIRIHNLGSIEAHHIEITFYLDKYEDDNGDCDGGCTPGPESDTDQTGVGSMASALKVYDMKYREVISGSTVQTINLVSINSGYYYNPAYLTDTNGNGYIDLADLENPINDLDNLPKPTALNAGTPNYTDYTQFSMSISLEDTGLPQNDFQGDIIDMTVEVTLNQDSTQ